MSIGNGKKVSEYKLLAIQADFEAGLATQTKIAAKHHIDRATLFRNAKKYGWEYGSCNSVATSLIKEKATERIIETETTKLVDYGTVHLKYIRTLRSLSAVNTSDLVKKALKKKDLSSIDRKEAERILAIQRVIELSMKTHDLAYKSERLAMGIKDSETTPVNINIGKVEDLDSLSDDELNLILSEVN